MPRYTVFVSAPVWYGAHKRVIANSPEEAKAKVAKLDASKFDWGAAEACMASGSPDWKGPVEVGGVEEGWDY